MAKYRKKPILIEAEQFWPDRPIPDGVLTRLYCTVNNDGEFCEIHNLPHLKPLFRIKTLEGELSVSPGDWVITGIQGEKYPCKPDIFEATYELAE